MGFTTQSTFHRPVAKLVFEGDRRLWVQSRVAARRYRTEVYDPLSGEALATLPLPDSERLLLVRDRRVYTAREAPATGLNVIVVYELRRDSASR